MASCDKCGREIKNYGVYQGGIRCPNYCGTVNDQQQYESIIAVNIRTKVKDLKKDGVVGISIENLYAITPTPPREYATTDRILDYADTFYRIAKKVAKNFLY